MDSAVNNEEIKIFQEYLRIPSVHPDIDYEECVEFIKKQAANLGLPVEIFYPGGPTKPIVILTWTGIEPNLPSILLNSHMDVVPVSEKNWTHPPFRAEIDSDGKIYARGAQDMKCVGTQYLAAIRAFKKEGKRFRRTIHVSFVPDEEIGGTLGMEVFVSTEDFKKLNVGFVLDEGFACTEDFFYVLYGERIGMKLKLKINGEPGHGSTLGKNTTGEKLSIFLNEVMKYRNSQVKRLEDNSLLELGDVTSINLTEISGGLQDNVIPPHLFVTFDIRLALDVNFPEFERKINNWAEIAGGDIELNYTLKDKHVAPTKTDNTNPYWVAFKSAMDKLGLKTKLIVSPGCSDCRFLRMLGIPAFGFSPMNFTEQTLHAHDEFIRIDTYIKGIEIYKELISNIANV